MSTGCAPRLAIVADDPARATGMRLLLGALGYPQVALLAADDWTSRLAAANVDHLVLCRDACAVLRDLAVWSGRAPCPVSLIGPAPPAVLLAQLLDAGVAGWWQPTHVDPLALAATLLRDAIVWRQRWPVYLRATDVPAPQVALGPEAARRAAGHEARRLIARVAGASAPIGLSVAADLAAAPSGHAPDCGALGPDAAAWARAVNRAGLIRMLSQRLVRLRAQQQAGIWAEEARRQLPAARTQLVGHLDYLQRLACTPGFCCDARQRWAADLGRVARAWHHLDELLFSSAQAPQHMRRCDAAASILLDAAEGLVAKLQDAPGALSLEAVNRCGRMRMQVQRVVKEGLLGVVLSEPGRFATQRRAHEEFERALSDLSRVLATTASLHRELTQVCLPSGEPSAVGLHHLIWAGDLALDTLDRLTNAIEKATGDLAA